MKTFRAALCSLLLAGAVAGSFTACSSAYADQKQIARARMGADPRIAIASAPIKSRAPYDVQIIREDGGTLATYAKGNRYYVLGNNGERYTVHVTNPTARRIEAVLSIDGLDAVDGENGDLNKRGYIIQPYGELRVEGFRTSTDQVATFRFSSVDGSYAGKKGKARNVGVVAVALFEEQPGQQLAAPVVVPSPGRDDGDDDAGEYDWTNDVAPSGQSASTAPTGGTRGHGRSASGPTKSAGSAPRAEAADDSIAGAMSPSMPAPRPPPPPPYDRIMQREKREYQPPNETITARPTNRQGLGTEFGESRYSPTQFTQFVRSSTRPIAIAELRYNDVSGLRALGIDIEPLPSAAEIDTRETADPFPGNAHFARPVH